MKTIEIAERNKPEVRTSLEDDAFNVALQRIHERYGGNLAAFFENLRVREQQKAQPVAPLDPRVRFLQKLSKRS